MSESQQSHSGYIIKSFDEFNDSTIIKHKDSFQHRLSDDNVKSFTLQKVKQKDLDAILLVCSIKSKDWFFPTRGNLIFNCDQQNHEVDFQKSNSDVERIGKISYCFEHGYYEISMDILDDICSCAVLKIRLSGESDRVEPDAKWCQSFQSYCRQFYNGVIDSTKYSDKLISASKVKAAKEPRVLHPISKLIGHLCGSLLCIIGAQGAAITNNPWWAFGLLLAGVFWYFGTALERDLRRSIPIAMSLVTFLFALGQFGTGHVVFGIIDTLLALMFLGFQIQNQEQIKAERIASADTGVAKTEA